MTAAVKGTAAARECHIELSDAFDTPDWQLVAKVTGHSLPDNREAGQVSGRDLKAESNLPGGRVFGPLGFKYRHDRGDTDDIRDALVDSLVNLTDLYWRVSDTDPTYTGAKTKLFGGYVSKLDKTAEGQNAIEYDVEVSYRRVYSETGALIDISDVVTPTP